MSPAVNPVPWSTKVHSPLILWKYILSPCMLYCRGAPTPTRAQSPMTLVPPVDHGMSGFASFALARAIALTISSSLCVAGCSVVALEVALVALDASAAFSAFRLVTSFSRSMTFLSRPAILALSLFFVSLDETTRTTICLLYTSDAADDLLCVDLGGRRIIKKKKTKKKNK